MATVINNPERQSERIIERSDNSGWVVAIIVLIAVILGAIWAYTQYYRPAPAPQGGTNINVTVPPLNSGGAGGTVEEGTQNPPSGAAE